jgi:hypothetical protein
MTDLPESVTVEWLGRQFLAHRDDLRSLRGDMDMLIRLVTRIDTTLDAVRRRSFAMDDQRRLAPQTRSA